MKVLLGAHTVNPSRGGEAGIGWAWAAALARHPRVEHVDVVAHPMGRSEIEARIEHDSTLSAKLTFHWVLPPEHLDPWKPEATGKKQWHRLLAHYPLWQHYASGLARSLQPQIDIAHHVTPGTIHMRSFVARLNVPYVLGPIGGGQAAPLAEAIRLLASVRDVHAAVEVARSPVVAGARLRPRLRQHLRGASWVFCANSQTLRLVKNFTQSSELMIDGGTSWEGGQLATLDDRNAVVLWVGKFEARKDPIAALDVIEALTKLDPGIRAKLVMVGDGWLHPRVVKEVKDRRLDDIVNLVGLLGHDAMDEMYSSASVFLFTSHRDTFGVQNLEAMTHGLPIVYRDSNGVAVGDFAGEGAIGVPASDSWPADAARLLSRILQNPAEWSLRSRGGQEAAAALTWHSKAERAVDRYHAILARNVERRPPGD